jgi:hypothetical protein
MSDQQRECFARFLHHLQMLKFVLVAEDNERSRMFVKAEVERLESYLATMRDEIDKLKAKLQ